MVVCPGGELGATGVVFGMGTRGDREEGLRGAGGSSR